MLYDMTNILEEFKYIVKEKNMRIYITDNIEISSEENSDRENSKEESYIEE